jgi:hypothetical protein
MIFLAFPSFSFKPETKKMFKFQDEPVNLNRTMNVSIINALWLILVGEKLELDDPKLTKVIGLLDEFVRTSSGPVTPLISLLPHPSMAKLPILRNFLDYDAIEKAITATNAFIRPYIEEHEKTLDPENIRDFMDLMILEIKKTEDKSSSFFGRKGWFS